MLRLKFEAMTEAHSIVVGPCEGFRVAGNFLRAFPANVVLGEYRRHQWHVQEGHFSRYDSLEACLIYFADAEGTRSAQMGPFATLHAADGTMYADGELFAKFIDETLLWHSFQFETYWPNLIIMSA